MKDFEFYSAPKNANLKFYKLHDLDPKYLKDVAELLAEEWEARTAAGRMRVLEESKNSLPIHFALLDLDEAIGHIKLSRCLGDENAFYAESVIVSKSRRGQGLGTVIMRLSERYISEYLAPEAEKARMVLSTLDSAKFYQKIGYEPCYPMTKTKHSPMSEMYIRQSRLVTQEKTFITKYKGQDQYWLHKLLF